MGTKRACSKDTKNKTGEELAVKNNKSRVTIDRLQDSEEMFRALTETSPAMIIFHRGGKFLYVNPAVETITGYSRDELLNMDFWEFITPEYQDIAKARVRACLQGENPSSHYPEKILTKQGVEKWIEFSPARVMYHGQPAVMTTALDITGRKRAEKALQFERSQLLSIFEGIDEVIYVADLYTHEIIYANKAMQEKFGKSLVGGICYREIQERDAPCEFCTNDIILKNKGMPYRWEFHNPVADRDFEIVDRIIRWPDGRDVRFELAIDITERKRIEKALIKEKYILTKSQEIARVGNWALDTLTGELTGSVENALIFGYEQDGGTKTVEWVLSRLIPADRAALDEFIKARVRDGKRGSIDYRIERPDGSVRYVNTIVDKSVRDKSGRVIRLYGISQDVTERKQVEDTLRESENKFRVLAETSPAAIFLYQGEKYVYVNPMAVTLTGYSREELISGDAWEWIHPDFKELVKERAEKRQLGEQLPTQYEVKYRARDGREGWVDFAAGLVEYRGKPAGLAMAFDVSKRMTAEEALRESEERYRELVENANSIILRTDRDGNITFFNEFAQQFFGYTEEEILGRNAIGTIIPATDSVGRDLAGMLGDLLRHPETYRTNVHQNMRKNGELVWVSWTNKAIYDDAGNLVGLFSIGNDISQLKQAEKELNEAKMQAELYLDLMGHDINNMHQVALGYLELAQGINADEDRKELLEKPVEVLQRSARLIQNVQKLQRLRDGMFQTQDVDVCQMLKDVQRDYGAVPHKRVLLNVNGHGSYIVRANELLHDVFANLVINAIKHTGDSTDILVGLDIVKDNGTGYCRVVVEDDGPGIPDELKGRIFNRTLKGTNKARGMGLGLYLVKSLVESYNGHVWVEDRVTDDHTKGARFVVMIPTV